MMWAELSTAGERVRVMFMRERPGRAGRNPSRPQVIATHGVRCPEGDQVTALARARAALRTLGIEVR